jgi:hypothetical protein
MANSLIRRKAFCRRLLKHYFTVKAILGSQIGCFRALGLETAYLAHGMANSNQKKGVLPSAPETLFYDQGHSRFTQQITS